MTNEELLEVKVTMELPVGTVNLILESLGKGQHNVVRGTIDEITSQVQPQVDKLLERSESENKEPSTDTIEEVKEENLEPTE